MRDVCSQKHVRTGMLGEPYWQTKIAQKHVKAAVRVRSSFEFALTFDIRVGGGALVIVAFVVAGVMVVVVVAVVWVGDGVCGGGSCGGGGGGGGVGGGRCVWW